MRSTTPGQEFAIEESAHLFVTLSAVSDYSMETKYVPQPGYGDDGTIVENGPISEKVGSCFLIACVRLFLYRLILHILIFTDRFVSYWCCCCCCFQPCLLTFSQAMTGLSVLRDIPPELLLVITNFACECPQQVRLRIFISFFFFHCSSSLFALPVTLKHSTTILELLLSFCPWHRPWPSGLAVGRRHQLVPASD